MLILEESPSIEWNFDKERENIKKHHVDFSEAATVFLDQFSVTYCDEHHSDLEDREITTGMSAQSRMLLVVHTQALPEFAYKLH